MSQSTSNEIPTVRECVKSIHSGTLTSEQLVKICLETIDATDSKFGAWVYLDRDYALDQARKLDEIRRNGKPLGKLHGIPVAVKDIFDTIDMPTECGSAIYSGHQPTSNSVVVEKLRAAGAVILGKTASTEFAHMHPANTRNPHNQERTPGGSSSGSAAAVALGQAPLAIGSQTGGSTIRPASFCGIYGYKPTMGIISRSGALQTSATLDHVGLFARDPGDIALLCDALGGYDFRDGASYLAPRPGVLDGYLSEVPIEPNFVWIDMPYADRFTEATIAGCEELVTALGGQIERIPAPQFFSGLLDCHQTIYDYELYRCLQDERENHWNQLSDGMKSVLEIAGEYNDEQYQESIEVYKAAKSWFGRFFYDYDAILTPSAIGEAPLLSKGTGDPVCCTIWTLCGLPCLSLPLLEGEKNLPIGVQVVAGENEDDRLLRTTRWLLEFLKNGN